MTPTAKSLVWILLCAGWAWPATATAASYSETVLATPGIVAYYQMNEHPSEIGDALINSASPGTLDGLWGYEDNNPDTLPTSGEPGPSPDAGFNGLDADNFSAYFGGNFADDNEDGETTDNMSDQMDLGMPEELDSELATIALFMKATGDGNDARVFTTESGAGYPFRLIYGPGADYSSMVLVTGGDWGPEFAMQTTGAVIGDDQWHHVVVVRNGDDAQAAQFYYDGTDISADLIEPSDSWGATGATARIGARHGIDNFGWGSYEGHLDEFAYWNRALTAEEALALYDAAIGDAGLLGDYNNNGELDAGDLDLQAVAIAGGGNPPEFDLNGDDLVDIGDRRVWVNDLKNSWIGDANLDLEFNSSDMVQVFAQGLYEKDETAGWEDGDWNGDTKFDSGDMVAAFAAGGYEQGLRQAVAVVPEPTGGCLLLLGLLLLPRRRRQ